MRRSLGKHIGRGRVVVNGKPVGSISYWIDVWHDNPPHGRKGADGWAEGDFSVLQAAYDAGSASLELQYGNTVLFRITRLPMGGRAEIEVSGPVPGF
jgi:hypothetical protein